MTKTENFRKVVVRSPAELRAWLEAHHAQKESVWLVTFKKHHKTKYVSTGEVLDELLCFGWIDGVRRKLDDDRTMQLIAPRKAQHWAKSYKDRVAKLKKAGRVHEAGLRSIRESKKRGLWNFMDDVDALIKPEDLVEALDSRAGAAAYFDAFPPASRRFVLRWIKLAKTPATRRKRIEKTAALAAKNQRVPGS
ncbi:MAG: YdeI/OmpD-associated family protein [Myxococcota bacterium]